MSRERPVRSGLTVSRIVVAVLACGSVLLAAEEKKPSRWEKAVQAFEQRDKTTPPPQNAILFAGSSSIVGWKLPQSFPDLQAINRGFGGSQIADSTEFAPRLILPCKPRIVVFYAGDNDIAGGKSPEQVLEDFKAFVKAIHEPLPKTKIIFIAIKPSIARWRLADKMRAANKLIEDYTKANDLLSYVDVDKPMIGEDGKPRPELFVKDGLHLSPDGYKLWTELLMPLLK